MRCCNQQSAIEYRSCHLSQNGPSVVRLSVPCLVKNGWLDLDAVWMVGWLGPRMRQVVGISDCPMARGNFGGGYGASYCNQWGGSDVFVQKCVAWTGRGAIWGCEWVGPGIGVLDGVHIPQGAEEVFGFFLIHWFEWIFVVYWQKRNVFNCCEKFILFPYRQYIDRMLLNVDFKMYLVTR